jgi:CDP-diacylglycerol--serine O-phosphatidyltransferase
MRWLPNLLTLTNAFFGCIALLFIHDLNLEYLSYCIGVSLLCDLFDGYFARKLSVVNKMGKELDSLADIISFGIIPGALIAKIGFLFSNPIFLIGFLITLGSVYRLARFNVEKSQLNYFIGLPTPANTLMILGLAWGIYDYELFQIINTDKDTLMSPFSVFLIFTTFFSIFLMNSKLKILSFKILPKHRISWLLRGGFFLTCLILLINFRMTALAFIIPLLLFISILEQKLLKNKI